MDIVGVRLSFIRAKAWKGGISETYRSRCLFSSAAEPVWMDDFEYACDIDAEPLHRYTAGGYHPLRLGDLLEDGRYKVLHKLGWGGYSTVWAARDRRIAKYVALKISVSERRQRRREYDIMRAVTATKSGHAGLLHVASIIDQFQLRGPNGIHDCFVLEMMGPSVCDVVERRFRDERLPGRLARRVAKQALLGLDCLHRQGIAHGDLHTGNLAFTLPCMDLLCEEDFLRKLKKPEIGAVTRKNGKPLEHGMPDYLVRPAYRSLDLRSSYPSVKIIDFGESFLSVDPPDQLHTPLAVRAPEAIFKDRLDFRVDLWSMGCMLFELVTGQPPFDSIMTTPTSVVGQMLDTTGETLPGRWQPAWRAMQGVEGRGEPGQTLQEWLEEVYFNGEREAELSQEDIARVGKLISTMLRLEPSARASTGQMLGDPWFREE